MASSEFSVRLVEPLSGRETWEASSEQCTGSFATVVWSRQDDRPIFLRANSQSHYPAICDFEVVQAIREQRKQLRGSKLH